MLTNFRNRVIEYEKETGKDLIRAEVEALSQAIAKHMKVDGKKVRTDSLMVNSSCKKLSRLELIYSLKEADSKISILVSQAVDLYYASDKAEVLESDEYKMLHRFFEEQAEAGEDGFRIYSVFCILIFQIY